MDIRYFIRGFTSFTGIKMFAFFQIAENIEGVHVECPKPLSLYEQNKNVEMTWSFIVKPKVHFISYSWSFHD